jgi:hypothetical protein
VERGVEGLGQGHRQQDGGEPPLPTTLPHAAPRAIDADIAEA